MNRVGLASESSCSRRHIVSDDPITTLLGKLGLGVGDHILCLCGEPDYEVWARGFGVAEGLQDVRVLDHDQGWRVGA